MNILELSDATVTDLEGNLSLHEFIMLRSSSISFVSSSLACSGVAMDLYDFVIHMKCGRSITIANPIQFYDEIFEDCAVL